MHNTDPTQSGNNNITPSIEGIAAKLAETKCQLTYAAFLFFLVFLFMAVFSFASFDTASPQPTPGAPYKYETKLTIYLIHHLILLATLPYCIRKAVLLHNVAMDYRYKELACELLASAVKTQNNGNPSEITKQITRTALKIIAENPTRLLGSWEQQLPDSTTAQRSDADSPR
ncbi:MAG: hypothetical protein RLZZ179_1354 [Verrucomicrobiota bacterium]|jgi:hypothetical protein